MLNNKKRKPSLGRVAPRRNSSPGITAASMGISRCSHGMDKQHTTYAFKRCFYPLTPIGCPAGGKGINASLEAHLDPPQPSSTPNGAQGLPDFIVNSYETGWASCAVTASFLIVNWAFPIQFIKTVVCVCIHTRIHIMYICKYWGFMFHQITKETVI